MITPLGTNEGGDGATGQEAGTVEEPDMTCDEDSESYESGMVEQEWSQVGPGLLCINILAYVVLTWARTAGTKLMITPLLISL